LNSKYIIILSHIDIDNPKYVKQFNIVYHDSRAGWCRCIRFFTHQFIHKKLTDKLITELIFRSRKGNYVEIREWREKDTEETLKKLIEENVIGPVIRRFEIKK